MSRFTATVVLLIAMGLAVLAEEQFRPMKYKNCKSKFEVLSVEAIGCGDGDRCVFYHNSEPRIRIAFRPNRPAADLRTSVWANLGDANGALTKFRLENDRTCDGNNVTCPLVPGQDYYYTQSVRILSEYPTVDVQINWLITSAGEGGAADGAPPASREVCIKFLGTVKKPE